MARLRRVVSQLRVDGRLPDPVGRLARDLAILSSRQAVSGITARVLPPAGRLAPWAPTETTVVSGRSRRWAINGEATTSSFDLAYTTADTVVEALQAHGLRPFLTRADDRSLQFGLPASARPQAWRALKTRLGSGEGWYLEWRRGNRRRVKLLSQRCAPRSALGAEWWKVFRLHRVGEGAVVGRDEATEITFWAPGEQGRMERLGLRGLHRFPADAAPTTEAVNGHTYPGVASFPVGAAMTRFTEPIDVVYTWVDGSDLEWRGEFERWRRRDPPEDDEVDDAHPGRYASRDELRYSLRSLWLYAGWARRIYLVTAGQVPPWLEPDDRLMLVPHREIFPEEWLPTFNSHAIESRLHHIDGLAEHFIYFNDDVFLGRPVERTQFFTPNGLLRFTEGEAWVVDEGSDPRNLAVDVAARNGRALIEATFGRIVEHKLAHVPHALRRSVLFEIEERFPERLEAIGRHRFRHRDDLAIASGFAQHYAFCTSSAIPGELSYIYQNVESGRLPIVLRRLRLGRDVDAFCLNQTEVIETDPERVDRLVPAFLSSYFTVPSPWERDRNR